MPRAKYGHFRAILEAGGLPEGWTRDERGRLFDENGRKMTRLGFPAPPDLTPERRRELLAKGRETAAAKRREKADERAERERLTKEQQEEVQRQATVIREELRPMAIERLREIVSEGTQASHAQIVAASKLILEHADGRPTQRIENTGVSRIIYELAEHEPAPLRLVQ